MAVRPSLYSPPDPWWGEWCVGLGVGSSTATGRPSGQLHASPLVRDDVRVAALAQSPRAPLDSPTRTPTRWCASGRVRRGSRPSAGQLGASAPAPEPSPAQEEGAATPAVEEVEARPAEEQLRDFVILAEPPPEVVEPKPAEAAAACEEDDEEGWIEICADEPTDTSDWEGAG